jgi:hypothetical protein
MANTYKLPLDFDAKPLQADLQAIMDESWAAHFNKGYFEGDWSGVALRSLEGDPARLYPDPHAGGEVSDTPILTACPNVRRVLESFKCPVESARLLRLGPGSVIREHRDFEIGRDNGQVRLHIPVLTNDQVRFYLDGRLIKMQEGECWYLDFSLPHRVENRGSSDRIHLVIDCTINDWLNSLLPPESNDHETEFSAPSELEEFRKHVLSHIELHERLLTTDDRKSFASVVVEVGRECGFNFSRADVIQIIIEERSNLLKQWIH